MQCWMLGISSSGGDAGIPPIILVIDPLLRDPLKRVTLEGAE